MREVILITAGCWITGYGAAEYVELNNSKWYTEPLHRKHSKTYKVYETLVLHHLWATI